MRFRPTLDEDATGVCELMSGVDPESPWDPAIWRHARAVWKLARFPAGSYVVERGGRPVALAEWVLPATQAGAPRYGTLRVGTAEQDAALFEAALAVAEHDLRGLGADGFAASTREGEDFRPRMLRAAGFAEDRIGRWWELDLRANRDRLQAMAVAARAGMVREGIVLVTMAAASTSDPDLMRKVYDVDRRATADVPTTVPHVTPPFEAWLRTLESPALHRDRMWLAVAGDAVLGMSWLSFPASRGPVSTDWTGVAPEARRRGLARALKLETLMQAIELGIERVRTENDADNAPILRLNEQLGYRAIPGRQLWLKQAL